MKDAQDWTTNLAFDKFSQLYGNENVANFLNCEKTSIHSLHPSSRPQDKGCIKKPVIKKAVMALDGEYFVLLWMGNGMS